MAINVETILNLGDDQMASQYSVIFPQGIPGGGDATEVALRCDQPIDPPENTVNVYDIFHKGYKFTKTGMLQDTTKEITLDIRLDQDWNVYDTMETWANMSYDHSNGTALSELLAMSTMIIQAEDKNQDSVKLITFRYVKPKSIKIGSFDPSNGDPMRITVNFVFVEMKVS